MKYDIGDLVDYQHAPKSGVYTGIVLDKKFLPDAGNEWYYKLYFLYEEDEAWIEERNL